MKKEIKDFKKDNAGRSMTEMLGVLAVIGVLSVGGITGYKLAMNHYAANQIAYEINMLRTDAKVKIAQGAKELTFDEPYHSGHFRYDSAYGFDGYCFSEGDETSESCANASGYEFKLSEIPGSICPILEQLLINMGGKVDVNPTSEGDESSECQEESNIMYVVFEAERFGITGGGEEEGEEKEPCNPETCEGECTESGCEHCSGSTPYWNGNLCVGCPSDAWKDETKTCTCSGGRTWNIVTGECVCSDPNNNNNNMHWDESSSSCVSCESGKVWNNGQCEERESSCQTNADCNQNGKSGYYCYTNVGESECVEFGSSRTTGKCRLVSSDLTKKAKINGTTYYGSGRGMTWWSACRLCAARAGQSDSVCASGTSGTTNEPDFMAGWGDPDFKCAHEIKVESKDWGYCHADETTGKTSSSSSNVSETIVALRKMYNYSSYWLWLRNKYDSCSVNHVYLSNGNLIYYFPSGGNGYALCR